MQTKTAATSPAGPAHVMFLPCANQAISDVHARQPVLHVNPYVLMPDPNLLL